MKRILAAIACLLVLCMAGGALAETTLRMAVGYNNAKTGLVFDAETAGEGITLADGKTYHPEVIVVGFDGCWTTSDLYGTPHETFNRYVSDYNESLKTAVYASSTLKNSIYEFSTVPDIAGGKADFIDDGLHYADTTLEALSSFIAES